MAQAIVVSNCRVQTNSEKASYKSIAFLNSIAKARNSAKQDRVGKSTVFVAMLSKVPARRTLLS